MPENSIKLILCEKPSQARDVARVLRVVKDGKTYIETRDGTITWAFGHLLELADFGSYDPVFKSSHGESILTSCRVSQRSSFSTLSRIPNRN